MPRPDTNLARVDVAFRALQGTIASMSDADARAASMLPGWSRGHVLTHIARNADGNADMVEGAIRGEVVKQYPGGAEQRSRDIEAGADRPLVELAADVDRAQARLVVAWDRMPDDAWERTGDAMASGLRPISAGVYSRVREISVHHVDLGLGYAPHDMPSDWIVDDIAWLREFRTTATWPTAPW
jgi:maleylpyruvate isomerase